MPTTPPPYPTHDDGKSFEFRLPLVEHPNLSKKSLELWPARVMMFEMDGVEVEQEYRKLILPYLPEELKRGIRAKTTVRQTQRSAWVDKYGDALPIWHISGTTGWRKRFYGELGVWLDGYESWRRLEGFFQYYQNKTVKDADVGRAGPELKFYNFYDEEYWVVEPLEISKYRNARRALLIGYEIRLVGIRRLDEEKGEVRDATTMPDPGKFLGSDALFLIELQKQIELIQSMLSQLHLILGITGASAGVLEAAGIVQIGVGVVQTSVKNLQFGNADVLNLSPEEIRSVAQNVLQFASTISDSTAIPITGAVLQLINVLNTGGIGILQLPSRTELFSGGSFLSTLSQTSQTTDIQTPIFSNMV